MTPIDVKRSEGAPMGDRLTQLANVCAKAMQESDHYRATDKAIFLFDNMGEHRGGAVQVGYDDEREALSRLIEQAEALAVTLGIELRTEVL